jgi:hypothetical protein
MLLEELHLTDILKVKRFETQISLWSKKNPEPKQYNQNQLMLPLLDEDEPKF